MHQTSVRFSRVEMEMWIKDLEDKRNTLRENLSKANKEIARLKKVLRKQKYADPFSKVEVPVDIINDRKVNHSNSKWKKIAIELLEKYDQPMTGQIAYKKYLLKNRCNHSKRDFILKNLCSAFYALFNVDCKISRCKNPYGRGYVYGLNHFFELGTTTLKPRYETRLNRELEVISHEEPVPSLV
jgi:hypothetical protein